jgi:hypothetical protein
VAPLNLHVPNGRTLCHFSRTRYCVGVSCSGSAIREVGTFTAQRYLSTLRHAVQPVYDWRGIDCRQLLAADIAPNATLHRSDEVEIFQAAVLRMCELLSPSHFAFRYIQYSP